MISDLINARLVNKITVWLKGEFQPGILVQSITTGLLIYILEIIVAVSFSALIFSGPLASQLPYGVALIVFGDALLLGIVALFSSFRGMIAPEQDVPGAILAITAASVMVAMPLDATPTQRLATVVAMIIGTSLLAGLFFILLGVFNLGDLVRFLPYPVIGGFLAGTGWTLVTGGLTFMMDTQMSLEWLHSESLLRWLPGLLLSVLLLFASSRFKNPLVVPGLIAAAIALFYAATWLAHIDITGLQENGWLLGSFPSGAIWRSPLNREILTQVDWLVLWRHLPALLSLPLMSVVALLLNTNGVELIVKKEVNLKNELVSTGIGNILSGLAGGITGYAAISLTTLSHTMSANRRLPGLLSAFLVGVTAFAGISLLTFVPKLVLGALLVFLGLGMLVEWVYQAWFKFPRVDFFIILLILGIVAVKGFFQAVGVGLVMTIILFVINYSRIHVVKHVLSGSSFRSRVTRSRAQQAFLDENGEQLYILKLQGFIFFGTANGLFEQIRERVSRRDQSKVRFVLLDFSQVSGLDTTGLLSFAKLLEFTQEHGIILVQTGLHGRTEQQFVKGGFIDKPGILNIFRDLDHGAEWCEDQLISGAALDVTQNRWLPEQLQAIWGKPEQIRRLIGYMRRLEIDKGQYLIHQGDDPDFLFMVESGQVTAQIETPDKPPVRLESMGGGRVVGELGFYLGSKRSAAVIADEPSIIYAISQADLAEIEQQDPEIASVFHHIIVHLMGERILHLIKEVRALQD